MNKGTQVEVTYAVNPDLIGLVGVVTGSVNEGRLHRVLFDDGGTEFFAPSMLKRHYDATDGMAAEQVYELLARAHTHLIQQKGFWNKGTALGDASPLRVADGMIIRRMSELRTDYELDCPFPDVSDITTPHKESRSSNHED